MGYEGEDTEREAMHRDESEALRRHKCEARDKSHFLTTKMQETSARSPRRDLRTRHIQNNSEVLDYLVQRCGRNTRIVPVEFSPDEAWKERGVRNV